jgi:hypothetical protein
MADSANILIYGPPLAPPVELSRWLLDHFAIPFQFETAAAGLSAIRSSRAKMPIELPLLYWNGQPSGGLKAAFDRIIGPIAAANAVTIPPFDFAFVDSLITQLFSPAIQTFYWSMLPRPDLLKPLATSGVPMLHKLAIYLAYPLWRRVMTNGLNLDRYDPTTVLAGIDSCFRQVEARLAGAQWLAGTAPGIEDMVFAALASPVLLPPGHPVTLPPIETFPEPLAGLVQRLRETGAGKLALRTYATAR